MPSLSVTCYAVLVDIPGRSALLRREMEEKWISWGDGKWREGLVYEEGRKTVLRMYKRRINKKTDTITHPIRSLKGTPRYRRHNIYAKNLVQTIIYATGPGLVIPVSMIS